MTGEGFNSTANTFRITAISWGDIGAVQFPTYDTVFKQPYNDELNIEAVDLDNDGDLDVVMNFFEVSSTDSLIRYENDGLGNFSNAMLFGPGTFQGEIKFADFNDDSLVDFVQSGGTSALNVSRVATQDASGDFTFIDWLEVGWARRSDIAVADIDGDSDIDILMNGDGMGLSDFNTAIYLNDGSGNFSELTGTPFKPVWDGSVDLGDVNNDGYMDVLITGEPQTGADSTFLYLSDGLGGYNNATDPFTHIASDGDARFFDADNDGDLDVFLLGRTSTSPKFYVAELYENDGAGNFTLLTGMPFYDGYHQFNTYFDMEIADVNSDGYQDIIVVGIDTSVASLTSLYINTTCNPTVGTDIQTACNSFTWIDGMTYTSSTNTPTYVLSNARGCDSTVTLSLTIAQPTVGTDVQIACNSYTWIDGNTYTASNNTASWVLTNAAGCDSLVTLDLTINHSSTVADIVTACDSYTWIDGITYTSSTNIPTHILTNASGCDSVVTLDLTINNSDAVTDLITACETYTWIDGNTYTSSTNIPTFVLSNSAGCDSVVSLDLTINTVDASTTNSSPMLSANLPGASYQWIDCDNSNAIIPGEMEQTYTATSNGNYAVIIDDGNCVDTSACMSVFNVGLQDLHNSTLSISPNPSSAIFNIKFPEEGVYLLTVLDTQGKVLLVKTTNETDVQIDLSDYESAVYFLRVERSAGSTVEKLIKN